MKKILSLVLSLTLCLGLSLPAAAYNDTGTVGMRNTFSLSGAYTSALDKNGNLMLNIGAGGDTYFEFPAQISSMAYGAQNRAYITTDGSLWMGGNNKYGQLGNGSNQTKTSELVKVMDNVAAVSCGTYHTAAIKTDGSLWMWGANYLGQLGNGTLTDSNVPVKVMDNVAAVCCGTDITAIIKSDGSLWMCGCNNSGQLGDGWDKTTRGKWDFPCRTVPVKIMDNVVSVSCGSNTAAAITGDGTLWMWGYNDNGELGNGKVGNDTYNRHVIQTTPIKVMENVSAVSVGEYHVAAIKDDNTLWVWGLNRYGQLGNGWTGNQYYTVPNGSESWYYALSQSKLMDDVAAVNCSDYSTAVVKRDGSVWVWGLDVYTADGEKITNGGKGTFSYQSVPVKVLDGAAVPAPPSPTVAGFNDVYESDYYADAVVWAKESGVTSGTSATTFSPSTTVTRAQAVTFLWRAAGSPQPSSTVSPFSDVSDPSAYYYNAVLWAAEQGITNGVTATTFGTGSPVAYDQMLAFLARSSGADTSGGSWSQAAIDWAADNGLTDGLAFTAKDNCPRADVVYCLWKQLA